MQERFWSLFSKKLTNEANTVELEELESLFSQHTELQHQADIITQMWGQEFIDNMSTSDQAFVRHLINHKDEFFSDEMHAVSDQHSETIFERKSPFTKVFSLKRIFTYSAVLLVSLAAFYYFPKGGDETKGVASNAISSVVTKNGSRTKITLPDGSQVWLNAGSKLDYNDISFSSRQREVYLSGEAFFDVVKNPQRPFIVHTSNMQVKVLGTAFNVKSYPGEIHTETSLIRGMVEVTIPSRPAEKYILNPNEKLILNNTGIVQQTLKNLPASVTTVTRERKNEIAKEPEAIVSIKKVNYLPDQKLILETAWVENRLEFRSEKFLDIARKMERWYDVEISFSNPRIENKLLTGSFEKETIEQALEALRMVESFNYSINGRTIVIKP